MTRSGHRDAVELAEGDLVGAATNDHAMYCRLQCALASARAVYMREACWTRYGAHYMRLPFRRSWF